MGSLKRLAAEVIFPNPNDVTAATATLIELDCEVEELDWTDPSGGPHLWIVVRTVARLDGHEFFHWIGSVVAPLGGDLVCAGLQENIELEIKANAQ